MISIGFFLCYACFLPFLIFFDCFLIFDFFLRGQNDKIRASVLRKTRRIDPRTPEAPIWSRFMKKTFSDEKFKKSNHAPRRAHDLISRGKAVI